MFPKIHKANNPGRPIVSAVSYPSSKIATFLDAILTPLVQQLPTFVMYASDSLRIFDAFRFTTEHRYLFTMNVKSLQTVIANADGLIALKRFHGLLKIFLHPHSYDLLSSYLLRMGSPSTIGFMYQLVVWQ